MHIYLVYGLSDSFKPWKRKENDYVEGIYQKQPWNNFLAPTSEAYLKQPLLVILYCNTKTFARHGCLSSIRQQSFPLEEQITYIFNHQQHTDQSMLDCFVICIQIINIKD